MKRILGMFVVMLFVMFVSLAMAEEVSEVVIPGLSMNIFGAAGMLAIAIPFILGLLKKKAKLSKKLCPYMAFALGALGGLLGFYLKFTAPLSLVQAIMAGVAVGGTSTGLYDIKKVIKDMVYEGK